jgi:beta-glucosidase
MKATTLLPLLAAAARVNAVLGADNANPQLHSQAKIEARDDLAYSPPHYPSPWMNPEAVGWEEAYAKAQEFVSHLTLLEKVNLTTGVG